MTMRLSVTVERDLLREATRISGTKSKREAIERGLEELIRSSRRSQALRHAGMIPLRFKSKELIKLRERDTAWRKNISS
ncbi:MAG: type II toxin-antitoxin system VapB family antitoxin [Elusimicrobia bacterium]|nr:type II toxin-antitoxin system VapB family antitoxin [Elusimicrobiota bacterium]